MTNQSNGRSLLIIAIVAILLLVGYSVLNAPDQRSGAQKVSDAIEELPNGVDKAARQLEDRTPAEKLGDAAEDVGDDVRKATNQE